MKIKKPEYLYHGSPYKLKGKRLIPKKAKGAAKHDILKAVYATDSKQYAIAMSLIACKGVGNSSLSVISKNKAKGIIYSGWPEQKEVYLYVLPSEEFVNIPKGSCQWVSFKSVKPICVKKLKLSDYIHLVRKASKKEIKKAKRRGWIK